MCIGTMLQDEVARSGVACRLLPNVFKKTVPQDEVLNCFRIYLKNFVY